MDLLLESHPDAPAVDIAVSELLLRHIAAGEGEPAIRAFRPGPTAAFGRLDGLHGHLPDAAGTARGVGLTPVMRVAGGHAACYDRDSVVVEIFRREDGVFGDIEARFEDMAEFVVASLASLAITVEIGELPGEYCPGRFSLHLPGGPKVAGVAQRQIRRASLTSAVIVVAGGERVRAATEQIYRALELRIDPRTTGALADLHHAGAGDVLDALVRTAGARYQARAGELPASIAGGATAAATRHLLAATGGH